MTKQTQVTLSAVVARINRKLKRQHGSMIRKTRGERAISELGEFYEFNIDRNLIVARDVDPENLARELGVLAASEVVEQEVVEQPRVHCALRAV